MEGCIGSHLLERHQMTHNDCVASYSKINTQTILDMERIFRSIYLGCFFCEYFVRDLPFSTFYHWGTSFKSIEIFLQHFFLKINICHKMMYLYGPGEFDLD